MDKLGLAIDRPAKLSKEQALAKRGSHSVGKRQVAQEFLAGKTLHGLAKRHDLSRNLIRIWVGMYRAGAFDEDAAAADLVQQYEARIAALERLVGKQVLCASTFSHECAVATSPQRTAITTSRSFPIGQRA